MYKLHTHCRACGFGKDPNPTGAKTQPTNDKLLPVFDLGVQSLANDFRFEHAEHYGYAPLKVMFCPRCTLAQLSVVVKPEILYSNYPYVTSKSQTMQDHFNLLWYEIQKEGNAQSLVEIGSNDGDFLMLAKYRGVNKIIGIDPAQNLSALAVERGLTTVCDQFNSESAYSAGLSVQDPDVIVARHVFCHIDDWQEFMRGIAVLAGNNTLLVIEVPYVVDLLKNVEFDTIYHEHLSYASVTAIRHLLQPTDFHIHKIVKFPIHGGALAIMVRRNDSSIPAHESASQFRDFITADTWREFSDSAHSKIRKLSALVRSLANDGHSVCGFGASAKSTVWINACGFDRRHIRFICDSTPGKQWTLSPGSNIPITDEGALMRELPHTCINFAWNFHEEILRKNQDYIGHGGRIITPFIE